MDNKYKTALNIKPPSEFNFQTITLAIILAIILTAANAYIGLLVGMTVSASIPAAALSMAIMSWLKNSSILQNNMVQTSASAGEALAAGVIFTVPALVLMQAWQNYAFFPILILALSGGLLGVIFTIPLRRALIIDQPLAFPEGVATSEVLKAGFELSQQDNNPKSLLGVRHLLQATGVSALFKLIGTGFGIFASGSSWVVPALSGKLLTNFSIQFSPAILGVGYIVGFNIAALVFIGGLIGSLIGIPLSWHLQTDFWLNQIAPSQPQLTQLQPQDWQQLSQLIWQDNRKLGVGAMLVGGIWSLVQIIKPVFYSLKMNLVSFKQFNAQNSPQNDKDLPLPILLCAIPLLVLPLIYLIYPLLNQTEHALLYSVIWVGLLLIFAFVFSSVAAYMAGVVGSSNNPISGVTIATVLISALIWFYLLADSPLSQQLGGLIVMFLASVICSAAAISGDNLQDLKCGHILGASPWKQQVFQMLGVLVAAIVLPFILILLDNSYGIGRPSLANPHGDFLAAPQAALMQALTTGIFEQSIDWLLIKLGALIAIVIIVLDLILKKINSNFRLHVLAVAIGIYLPLALAVSLFIGGLLKLWIDRKVRFKSDQEQAQQNQNALLLASGLITGEALMGVGLAVFAGFIMPLPKTIEFAEWTGLIAFFLVCLYLYKRSRDV
ncbi:oligopeptide transporter, OPT family [Catenovulum sp. 2E275]|uniref:OPT family oligopeptide transporter n=1 Tax=Catenovulum sp. 2E275 TaxID=2980497 RepID=UPI0021CEA404|nr:oligopeptide transporter, OPT family [Catenovulum sp. 2E275]MCU4676408.1 oligopeptide transporter, OPT family [Catenovulum sp. 2E275]